MMDVEWRGMVFCGVKLDDVLGVNEESGCGFWVSIEGVWGMYGGCIEDGCIGFL